MTTDAVQQDTYSPGEPVGSTVQPVYQKRTMNCYVVTESELRQLGIANIGITAFAAIGSFCIAFGFDVLKDTWLTTDIPENAQSLLGFVQSASFLLGVAFYGFAGIAWRWRIGMLNLIKDESKNEEAVG
ncbi:MAG: hypothetical protein NXH88_07760 [Hyphomonas sp.]|nr:hypothetical protein [Hyphomonas sp.]